MLQISLHIRRDADLKNTNSVHFYE